METVIEKKEVYAFEQGLSPATAKLIDRLKTGKIDDVITDEELKSLCGKATRPNHQGHGNLATAIKRVERDSGLVWRRINGANAIKCLDAYGIASVVKSNVQRIRKRSKRTMSVGKLADISKLNDDEKKHLLVNLAQAGTICLITKSKTMTKLLERGITTPVDEGKLLEAFKTIKN